MWALVASAEVLGGCPSGGAHAHPCDSAMSGSSASVCLFDALEPLGKHLPAHGRVTQACVCPPPWGTHPPPPPRRREATRALIGSACRRLSRPATAHPGLALPTMHPRTALASLVTPGPACGGW